MKYTKAIVRAPGRNFARALSNHPERESIDHNLAVVQHKEYVAVLRSSLDEVIELEWSKEFADAPFTQDVAVVAGGRALINRTGAGSRRGEFHEVQAALARYLPYEKMVSPAKLEGGDVLNFGHMLIVGVSERTNKEGVLALRDFGARAGVLVVEAQTPEGFLHLESCSSPIGAKAVLGIKQVLSQDAFVHFEKVEIPIEEATGGNVLAIGASVIIANGYPVTKQILEDRGFDVIALDLSEFEKADGGPSCLSLLF